MICAAKCPREIVPQHTASPGTIRDDEIICRAGYDDALNAKGEPKSAVIRSKELLAGETMSFWRAFDGEETQIRAAEKLLQDNTPKNKTLSRNLAPRVGDIRSIEMGDLGRLFSVIDDCRTDYEGGFHPLHCGVAICLRQKFADAEDLGFVQARDKLRVVLKKYSRPLLAAAVVNEQS